MNPVVPEGEGVASPLSLRIPEKLVKRVDAVAKATGNSRTETILHLMRWALDEYDRQRAADARTPVKVVKVGGGK
jgi:metal-responsive CopG/Arc/MetJ family transcriptional regulator